MFTIFNDHVHKKNKNDYLILKPVRISRGKNRKNDNSLNEFKNHPAYE